MKIFTWKQRLIVLLTTATLVALFGAVGYLIGSMVENWRAGVVIAVLISYPFTLWALAKSLPALYKKENENKEN